VAAAARFRGGEGLWYADGVVHFTTKGDNRVWRYEVATAILSIRYSPATSCNPVLSGVDNIVLTGPAFSPDGSRLYVSSQRGNGFGITYEVRGPFR
jgi:sugar lactone lactonase YvrE